MNLMKLNIRKFLICNDGNNILSLTFTSNLIKLLSNHVFIISNKDCGRKTSLIKRMATIY